MKSINIYLKLKNTGKTIFRIQDIKTLTGIEKYEYLKIYINRITKKSYQANNKWFILCCRHFSN